MLCFMATFTGRLNPIWFDGYDIDKSGKAGRLMPCAAAIEEKQENYAQFKNQAGRICAAVLKENSVGAIIFLFV